MIKISLALSLSVLCLCNSAMAKSKTISLEMETATQCRQFAIKHALNKLHKSWGEVGLSHVDRSLPDGSDVDPRVGEIAGYSNVSVVIDKESADSVQYEMKVKGIRQKGSAAIKCTIVKEIERDIL